MPYFRGSGRDCQGRLLKELRAEMSFQDMDYEHDYVQW